jgi:Ca2+-binding EF-hand superfamily protein
VRVLDTDKDGTISAAELAAAATALLTLDTNSDGALSAEELHPRPANAPTPPANAPTLPVDRPHPTDPIMLALDADGNGALSAQEIANAPKSLAALDLNKDGKLTPDEYRPLPPERPAN